MAYVLYDAMDYVLYDAVTKDDIDVLKGMEDRLSVADQLTPTKNTVLHLACQYGSIKCMEHILSVHKSLLLKINSRGETALHLAAREGHYGVVVALTDAAKSSLLQTQATSRSLDKRSTLTVIQFLIRTINKEEETALHNAVRYNHKEVVQLLVNEDPNHSHPWNKYGETPLYLASFECYTDIIRTILDNCESPQIVGPYGRTALHAALLNDGGHECVKLLLEKAKDLIKVADAYGWTAFHYVAHNDLYNIVEDLVRAEKYVGYAVDRPKRTALHVAASQGNVNVMKKLVEYYPDSWEIVDARGQNVLHIAVERDRKETIRFILSQGCKASNNILIQRDSQGNTPLHLIAKLGCYVQELMDARGCDWNVLNNEGFTPLDILDNGRTDTTLVGDQAMVRTTLIQAKAKRQYLPLQNLNLHDTATEVLQHERYSEKVIKGINTHIIVAALITTVALTAGFAMPGGFDGNKGSTQGSPMLLRKTAFQTFIVTDAIALLLSISSIFLYFWTILIENNIKITEKLFVASTLLNLLSIMSMMLAFITGTYAVLAHSVALAVSVCVISSVFFFVIIYVLYKIFMI